MVAMQKDSLVGKRVLRLEDPAPLLASVQEPRDQRRVAGASS